MLNISFNSLLGRQARVATRQPWRRWQVAWQAVVIVAVVCLPTSMAPAEEVAPPTARIAGHDGDFATIQAAIDAAEEGAVIELTPGRFNERIKITKPLTLVGAGADRTVIGPTSEDQTRLRDSYEKLWASVDHAVRELESLRPRREPTDEEKADFKRQWDEIKELTTLYAQPAIEIHRGAKTELCSLKATMPDAPRRGSGLRVTSVILIKESDDVLIEDCAIVGGLSNGIQTEDAANGQIVNSLIAACWGSGVYGGAMSIRGCDIRNNYHYNLLVEGGAIENCRISGSAWSGISGSAARVEQNAIFDNARAGVYSVGIKGVVKHNLIYRNGSGAGCAHPQECCFDANLFIENKAGAIYVAGPCEPTILRNTIIGSSIGIHFGPKRIAKGEKPPASEFCIKENLFWRVETPAARFTSNEPGAAATEVDLAADAGNREVDPLVTIGSDERLVIGGDSPIDAEASAALRKISLQSRWPLTEEERAMIPEDGTRDWEKWKMQPKE